jgi:hypothetical protein
VTRKAFTKPHFITLANNHAITSVPIKSFLARPANLAAWKPFPGSPRRFLNLQNITLFAYEKKKLNPKTKKKKDHGKRP